MLLSRKTLLGLHDAATSSAISMAIYWSQVGTETSMAAYSLNIAASAETDGPVEHCCYHHHFRLCKRLIIQIMGTFAH